MDVKNGAQVTAHHLLVSEVQGGHGGEHTELSGSTLRFGGPGLAVRVQDATLELSHLTAMGLEGGEVPWVNDNNAPLSPGLAQAIRVESLSGNHTVKLDHVIVSDVSGGDVEDGVWCLWSDSGNALSKLQVSNSNLHACGPEGSDGANYAKNAALLDGMMYVDPLFMDPNNGNYRLSSGSPLIDAGVSGVEACLDYELEPEPNGCALNLGYYGGTEEAATKAGADHCVCPVED
jgi:hypothetical protein